MAISLRKKITTLLRLDFKTISALLSQKHQGYLFDIGWFEAFKSGSSIDKNNKPVPWLTYPFISFISERLNKTMDLFEFGSGNSTFFYSEKVNSVTTVEHNQAWYEKVSTRKKNNVTLLFVPLDENDKYCRSAIESGKKYDLIIIDAEDRVNCIINCLDALKENGIIILDDSERKEYLEGVEFLLKNFFKKIDFWGIAPGVLLKKCTTIFYKPDNCVNI